MDIPNNNINQAVMNAINNPFLINSLTQSIMQSIGSAGPFQINNLNKKDEPNQHNKRNVHLKELTKYKKSTLTSDEDIIDDDNEDEDDLLDKNSDISKNMIKNKKKKIRINKETSNTQSNISEEKSEDNSAKEGTFVYTDDKNNKYLYAFHKISSDEQNYELRCKDRNCKGRAKYNLINKDIHIIQE